jgi:hypothetical protein
VARVVGAVGVLGVLAFAIVAFAPRMSVVANRLSVLTNRVELPWDPVLFPGPAPLPLDRQVRLPAAVVAQPLVTSEAMVPSTAQTSDEPPSEPQMSTMPPTAVEPSQGAASTSSDPAAAGAVPPRAVPPLTAEEIEQRRQRYERWLESEGLERIQ